MPSFCEAERLLFNKKRSESTVKKKVFWTVNLLLLCAMVLHVGICWYSLSQDPLGNSAPAWVSLLNALYYLVPLALLHIGRSAYRRRSLQNKS